MRKINVLTDEMANKIAAGEVVERPASVIKELVENSVDAGATKIIIEIKNGGISYIRVTDNGCGISPEDIKTAFLPHATSKIIDEEDLFSIKTLGFRGEALASIAAVSNVEIMSKTADENGTFLEISGGKFVKEETVGCPEGTTVVVKNLFFNTPARMKFLKRDSTEASYITDIVERLVMANPHISVRYIIAPRTRPPNPITLLFIIACTNIINLIDGLDGLSGGICSIFYLTIGIICFYQGRYGSLVTILTFIMLGSTLGFLLHNFHPAKIFAGDCATFMGFIIAVITLLEFKGPALISFFVPITILGIPILDTLFAIIRRLLRKQAPFKADKEHLHHQLLGMNFNQRTTVLIIYAIDLLFATASILYTLKDPLIGRIIYIIILIIVLWFVFHTTIISEKNPEMVKKIEKKLLETTKRKKSK